MPELDEAVVTPPVIEPPTPPVQPTLTDPSILDKVREDAKRQLYPQLEKEKAKAKAAEEKLLGLEAQLKELMSFKENVETEKLGDIEKRDRKILQLEKEIQDKEKEFVEKSKAFDEKLKLYEVAQFRLKRIREVNLDSDFEDFVIGTSEEEIENSIKTAMEKEAKFREKYTLKTEVPKPNASAPSAPATPYSHVSPVAPDYNGIQTRADLDKVKRELGLIR